ncbi:MAG: AAA family ATPase [Candidatus Hydrogenedens sp.]|nr:AAA family ATPase [Candidatus Hydrogenedens sp.]
MIGLNEQQRAAVTAPDGPALVLAGAGSGKTRVIIERLAYLIDERGIDPRSLLALTFTNKAAEEMRHRLESRLDIERLDAWMGTFHSFGLYMLRRDIELLGKGRNFTIADDTDQLSLMKRLVKDLPAKFEKVSPRTALSWISRLKQEVKDAPPETEELDAEDDACRALWHSYHESLHRANALDFDDLLVLPVKLLRDHPEARERWQRRFRHILVDEYQDTNRAQYLIARYLSESHRNLFVVGDEDQSIYSWRGADINNILDFAEDFEGAGVYRLEVNYRSTAPILMAANRVASNNLNRLGKTLRPAEPEGAEVRFVQLEDSADEARFVVEDIAKQGHAPKDCAIIYRTNNQSRAFEEALMAKGIQPRVLGGVQFYRRKEIKDLLAYLRLLVNPSDDESMRRVINVPTRGIGGTTMAQLEEYAGARNATLMQVLRDVEHDESLPTRARDSINRFREMLDNLAVESKMQPVSYTLEQVIEQTGYREYVEKSDEKDFRERIDNVNEFVSAAKQYEAKRGKTTLLDYLQDTMLLSDTDSYDPDAPSVTLLTCHTAKGLEFTHVYLVGMEEGYLPHGTDFDPEKDVEEERRLCYVAMTRARKSLVLTAARSRVVYGRTDPYRSLSRFVKEAGLLQEKRAKTSAPSRTAAPKARAAAGAPSGGADSGALKSGTRVRHARFGEGTVMYTSGDGTALKAKVRFKTGRTMMLMVSAAPLEILK